MESRYQLNCKNITLIQVNIEGIANDAVVAKILAFVELVHKTFLNLFDVIFDHLRQRMLVKKPLNSFELDAVLQYFVSGFNNVSTEVDCITKQCFLKKTKNISGFALVCTKS